MQEWTKIWPTKSLHAFWPQWQSYSKYNTHNTENNCKIDHKYKNKANMDQILQNLNF